jgi:hypothetical protein
MARKRKQRGEYGAGSTYQNKKGEWFAAFPLGKGERTVHRVADKQEGDAWREEMRPQRDEQHIDCHRANLIRRLCERLSRSPPEATAVHNRELQGFAQVLHSRLCGGRSPL